MQVPYRVTAHKILRGCWLPRHREVAAVLGCPTKPTAEGKFCSPDPLREETLILSCGKCWWSRLSPELLSRLALSRRAILLTAGWLVGQPSSGEGETVLPEGPSSLAQAAPAQVPHCFSLPTSISCTQMADGFPGNQTCDKH